MSAGNFVVIWDPLSEIHTGEVLTGRQVEVLKGRGVVMLPVLPDLMQQSPSGGYVKKEFGRGWAFDSISAQPGCPIALYATSEAVGLHWVARLVPEGSLPPEGTLRLTTYTGQPGASGAGLTPSGGPVHVASLGAPDAWGGWTIGGAAQITMPGAGHVGFRLYGHLTNARVRWLALSQSMGIG